MSIFGFEEKEDFDQEIIEDYLDLVNAPSRGLNIIYRPFTKWIDESKERLLPFSQYKRSLLPPKPKEKNTMSMDFGEQRCAELILTQALTKEKDLDIKGMLKIRDELMNKHNVINKEALVSTLTKGILTEKVISMLLIRDALTYKAPVLR